MRTKFMKDIRRYGGLALLAALSLFISQRVTSPDGEISGLPQDMEGTVAVHFIDVGQGDSILIETEDAAMLIDAGENNKGTTVLQYLEDQGIDRLDYIIGTHPHSDHIGGLDDVIYSIPVDKIIMPDTVHTTKTYEDVLDAIEAKKLKITKAIAGTTYELGAASFTIVAPNNDRYEDLNNYSVAIKLTYKDTSFLMAGDAEKLSEEEMLLNGMDISADVLKISHHGSAYSSYDRFLDTVRPDYAVISVGEDNSYGHPHKETLQALKDRGIFIYRTDQQQTIIFTTDGKSIEVNTQP